MTTGKLPTLEVPHAYELKHLAPTVVAAGKLLWRAHLTEYAFNAYNPVSKARFAVPKHFAMLYLAETPWIALMEAIFREIVAENTTGEVSIDKKTVHGYRLTPVITQRPLVIANLSIDTLRRQSDAPVHDYAQVKRWIDIIQSREHDQTHLAALTLLAQFHNEDRILDGLAWPSRQTEGGKVYVIYRRTPEGQDVDLFEHDLAEIPEFVADLAVRDKLEPLPADLDPRVRQELMALQAALNDVPYDPGWAHIDLALRRLQLHRVTATGSLAEDDAIEDADTKETGTE